MKICAYERGIFFFKYSGSYWVLKKLKSLCSFKKCKMHLSHKIVPKIENKKTNWTQVFTFENRFGF
jgi:hypothetical protein